MTLAQTYPDLRVLDLATNFAGPYGAMILGDMGANVIKVERATAGDDTRSLPPFDDGLSTVFQTVNRGKRSIMLDFRSDEDLAILRRLIARSDVVIESFPPGVAQRLGLEWSDVRALAPRCILASISAFGDGPAGRTMPGYDALVQAVSGLMSFTGHEGQPTARIAPSLLDLTTGIWAAMGIMAALARRASPDAPGEHLTLALIDTAFNMMNHQLMAFLATGAEPRRLGGGAPSAVPYGIYRAMDGEVLIATASDDQFRRLCQALGLYDLGTDARLATMAERLEHRAEIDARIGEAIQRMPVNAVLEALTTHRISAGKVNTVAEAWDLPVVRERALLRPVEGTRDGHQVRLPIDPCAAAPAEGPPRLDEHRAAIIAELADQAEAGFLH